MGGGGQTATTQQVTKTELPAWVQNASYSNYLRAQDVANRPYQAFSGQDIAGQDPATLRAYGVINALDQQPQGISTIPNISNTGILDATNPYYQQARDLYGQSAGPLDTQQYFDPFTQEVTNRAVANANTSLTQQLAQIAGNQEKAGAFGGSRGAIEDAVTRAQGVKNIGDLTAQLNSAAYGQALSAAQNQAARQAGAAAGLTGVGGAVQGAQQAQQAALAAQQNQQTGLANYLQQYGAQAAQLLSQAGIGQQGYAQSLIDAAKQRFQEARDYPVEQLNILLSSLGMSPYGKTETGTKTVDQSSSPDYATLGLGAFKTLMSVLPFSDREDKTDIQKLGKDPETGLDMYAYRYKTDPKTYPKVVGPMAQDIEKKFGPKTVKKFGGHRAINLENLMEALK